MSLLAFTICEVITIQDCLLILTNYRKQSLLEHGCYSIVPVFDIMCWSSLLQEFPSSLPAASQVALVVIRLPMQEMQEVQVGFLGQVDPPRGGNAHLLQYFCLENSHWLEEPGRLQSVGPQHRIWLSDGMHSRLWASVFSYRSYNAGSTVSNLKNKPFFSSSRQVRNAQAHAAGKQGNWDSLVQQITLSSY